MLIGIVFVISVGSLLPHPPAARRSGRRSSSAPVRQPAEPGQALQPARTQQADLSSSTSSGSTTSCTATSAPPSSPRRRSWSTIKAALPIDLEIIVISQILAFAAAIPDGDAQRSQARRRRSTESLGAGSFTLLSIPSFVFIVVLVLVVAIKLGVPHTGVVVLRFARHRLDHQPREPRTPVDHPGHRQLRRLLPRAAQRPHRDVAGRVHHDGALQGHQPAAHHVASRLSAVLGGAARHGGRQHRWTVRGRIHRAVPAWHPRPRLPADRLRSDAATTWSSRASCSSVSVGVIVINFAFDLLINFVDPRISRE